MKYTVKIKISGDIISHGFNLLTYDERNKCLSLFADQKREFLIAVFNNPDYFTVLENSTETEAAVPLS